MNQEPIYAFVVINCNGFIFGVYYNAQNAIDASRTATEEYKIPFRVSQERILGY
jgi:hypothetical protein